MVYRKEYLFTVSRHLDMGEAEIYSLGLLLLLLLELSWSALPNRFLATLGPPAAVAGPAAVALGLPEGAVNFGLPLNGLQIPPFLIGLIPNVMAGKNKSGFNNQMMNFLLTSICYAMMSELSFTVTKSLNLFSPKSLTS